MQLGTLSKVKVFVKILQSKQSGTTFAGAGYKHGRRNLDETTLSEKLMSRLQYFTPHFHDGAHLLTSQPQVSNVSQKLFALILRYRKNLSQPNYFQLIRGYLKSSRSASIASHGSTQSNRGLNGNLLRVSPSGTALLHGALNDARGVTYHKENGVFALSFPVDPASDVYVFAFVATL